MQFKVKNDWLPVPMQNHMAIVWLFVFCQFLPGCSDHLTVKIVAEVSTVNIGDATRIEFFVIDSNPIRASQTYKEGDVWIVEGRCIPRKKGHKVLVNAEIEQEIRTFETRDTFECCDCWARHGVTSTFVLQRDGSITVQNRP